LVTGGPKLSTISGVLYNDKESGLSFNFNPGSCQVLTSVTNNFPKIPTRFEQFVPAGASGWMKFYPTEDQAVLGAAINLNANAATSAVAYNQGRNLRKLTLTSTVKLTIPVAPPVC
jgi:hypothetical protein